MKENFISMAPDEESSAKVSLIDQNKTLMIDQYTSDVEAGAPEFVEDITNINDAFEHFKPKVGVTFTDAEGGAVEETLKFGEIRDFEAQGGKGRLDFVGWYQNNSLGKTHEVGIKEPNSIGLYDMSGNVFELCQDGGVEGDYSLETGNFINPVIPNSGNGHACRGGYWGGMSSRCSAFRRNGLARDNEHNNFRGFRVARSKIE